MSQPYQYRPPVSAEKRRKIAEDYYNTSLSVAYISKKHKITQSNVTNIAREIDPQSFKREKDIVVIKVESKWVHGISHLLESRGIPHEIPEHFELVEKFESKINQ